MFFLCCEDMERQFFQGDMGLPTVMYVDRDAPPPTWAEDEDWRNEAALPVDVLLDALEGPLTLIYEATQVALGAAPLPIPNLEKRRKGMEHVYNSEDYALVQTLRPQDRPITPDINVRITEQRFQTLRNEWNKKVKQKAQALREGRMHPQRKGRW